VASEALESGVVTRQALRTTYVKLHRNVYAPRDLTLTARDKAIAAWLWSRRESVLVGSSAAAMLGTKWLAADEPAELARVRQPSPGGIVIRCGAIADDELSAVDGIPVTTAARTAFDIGRRNTLDRSVIRVDAVLNAAGSTVADVAEIAARYPGARGIRSLRATLDLADGGAESPQETRLRLILVRAGLPRPVTQIPVADDRGRIVRRIDMGWPDHLVGVEYDGEQHWKDPTIHADDINRQEFLAAKGWWIIRVSARHMRDPQSIVRRVTAALRARGCPNLPRDYGR
jgi:hypothetical protein